MPDLSGEKIYTTIFFEFWISIYYIIYTGAGSKNSWKLGKYQNLLFKIIFWYFDRIIYMRLLRIFLSVWLFQEAILKKFKTSYTENWTGGDSTFYRWFMKYNSANLNRILNKK